MQNCKLTLDDARAIAEACTGCVAVGLQAQTTGEIRGPERRLADVTLRGERRINLISIVKLTHGLSVRPTKRVESIP